MNIIYDFFLSRLIRLAISTSTNKYSVEGSQRFIEKNQNVSIFFNDPRDYWFQNNPITKTIGLLLTLLYGYTSKQNAIIIWNLIDPAVTVFLSKI